MSKRICSRFGTVAGASTGLFINLLGTPACCSTQTLSFAQTIVYGMLASLVICSIAAAFACLVSRRPWSALLIVAWIIAIVVGGLLGPLAYALPHPMVAMVVCAFFGALLGVLVCWLLCLQRYSLVGGHR